MNLKVVMAKKNMNVQQLSDVSGLSTGRIYKYRTGERTPSVRTLQNLASALNCTVDELLKEEKQ